MDVIKVVEIIKRKFAETGHPAPIPLLKGSSFIADLTDEGMTVDNLGNQPLLPWAVFQSLSACLFAMEDVPSEAMRWKPTWGG